MDNASSNSNSDSLIPESQFWLRMLRLGLLLGSIGWGISFLFTFCSWENAVNQLRIMGAQEIPYQPLLDYWLRMASSAFGCIGIGAGAACINPKLFRGLVILLGPFHLIVGTVLLVAAARNHLDSELHPTFVPDITFCFVTAALIMLPLCVQYRRFKQSTAKS